MKKVNSDYLMQKVVCPVCKKERRQARSQELMAEIKGLAVSDGFEYAHSVLQRRYHQTVKQVQDEEI